MKNKVLTTTALTITALLALTSCSSDETSTISADSASAALETVYTSSEESHSTGNAFVAIACKVLDFATVFSLSTCESRGPVTPETVTESSSEIADTPDIEPTPTPPGKDQTPAGESEPENIRNGKIGQKLVNGGVAITIAKAGIVETIPMNRSGYAQGDAMATITDEKAEKGGKFLRVDTRVENMSSASMDVACDWQTVTKAVDSQKREFDVIDDIFDLEKNPSCMNKLQPGLAVDMSYVYLVPEDAAITSFKFRNSPDGEESEYTTINFSQTLK